MTCYLKRNLVEPRSQRATIQLHPREICHICWTLLEWYSVSLLGACKDPLTCLWSTETSTKQMSDKVRAPAVLRLFNERKTVLLWICVSSRETVPSCGGNNKKRRYSAFSHLSKMSCGFTVDLLHWQGWASLGLNKHELAWGKLTAKRLKVKLSRVTWLAMMHSIYSQPVLLVFNIVSMKWSLCHFNCCFFSLFGL